MTSLEHKLAAENLLKEGWYILQKISEAEKLNGINEIDKVRDRLGKKAMGIWAQAQVHATLALRED